MKATLHPSKLFLPVHEERDHIQGPVDSAITLLEYGDYECPHCAAAHQIIKLVRRDIGDRFRFVFRNFPLATIHPRAIRAAEAAEAAGGQNRFWQMHDLLFDHQNDLSDREIVNFADIAGLDLQSFCRNIRTHTFIPRVAEDLQSGVRSGVEGTPAFFINGIRYQGEYDPESLARAILEEHRDD
jgi:protein-disulfide isomerase